MKINIFYQLNAYDSKIDKYLNKFPIFKLNLLYTCTVYFQIIKHKRDLNINICLDHEKKKIRHNINKAKI